MLTPFITAALVLVGLVLAGAVVVAVMTATAALLLGITLAIPVEDTADADLMTSIRMGAGGLRA